MDSRTEHLKTSLAQFLASNQPSFDQEKSSLVVLFVDTREKLAIYAKAGLLSLGEGAALAKLGQDVGVRKD